jgi:hypothetical protein
VRAVDVEDQANEAHGPSSEQAAGKRHVFCGLLGCKCAKSEVVCKEGRRGGWKVCVERGETRQGEANLGCKMSLPQFFLPRQNNSITIPLDTFPCTFPLTCCTRTKENAGQHGPRERSGGASGLRLA